jgi:hypothetical protein
VLSATLFALFYPTYKKCVFPLCRIARSFWHSADSEKILSAFKEAVKVTVYQKSAKGDITCLIVVKYNFKFGIISKKSTLRYAP